MKKLLITFVAVAALAFVTTSANAQNISCAELRAAGLSDAEIALFMSLLGGGGGGACNDDLENMASDYQSDINQASDSLSADDLSDYKKDLNIANTEGKKLLQSAQRLKGLNLSSLQVALASVSSAKNIEPLLPIAQMRNQQIYSMVKRISSNFLAQADKGASNFASVVAEYFGNDPVDPLPANGTIQISESRNNPDPSSVKVEEDSTSDQFALLVFNLENDTDEDINLGYMQAQVETNGVNPENVINKTWLSIDKKYEGSHDRASGSGKAIYDFIVDYELKKNEKVEIEYLVEFKKASGNYNSDQKIEVTVGPNHVNGGENTKGTASSEKHTLVVGGEMLANMVSESFRNPSGIESIGNFTLKFKLTAVGDDVYIPKNTRDFGIDLVSDSRFQSVSKAMTSTAKTVNGQWVIYDGESETFTLQLTAENPEDGTYAKVELDSAPYRVGSTNAKLRTMDVRGEYIETDEYYIAIGGDLSVPKINKLMFNNTKPSNGDKLTLDIDIENAGYDSTGVLTANCDLGISWNLKVYGDICSDSIEMSTESFNASTFSGSVVGNYDNGEDIQVEFMIYNAASNMVDSAKASAEIQYDNSLAEMYITTRPYGQDGSNVGVVFDWDNIPGAAKYKTTVRRTNTYGSATQSATVTSSELWTGVKPNAGESSGKCYVFVIEVEAQDRNGRAIMVLDENGDDTESVYAEACYMATPGRTGSDPRVQGASTSSKLQLIDQLAEALFR